MLSSDIYLTFQWWLLIFIVGLGFLPLNFIFFNKFFDKGYIFSKVLGIGILSYIILVLGILRLAPFTQSLSWIVFFLLSIIISTFLSKIKTTLLIIKQHILIFLFEELFFILLLFGWAYIHSFNPDIHGLEKYMDFGFINSILRSDFFPPKDMWLAPFTINYYYFGHFVTAVLTKMANIPSNITFNLMLSTIFALCAMQAFSIGANIYTFMKDNKAIKQWKRIIAGVFTSLLVTLSGNLHVIYAFFKPYENEKPVPFWDLPFMPQSFPNSYWYPNATRFIHNTIHEFPIYSWVVADLHGHVLDIPFVLLIIAVLLSIFIKSEAGSKPVNRKAPKSEINSKIQNAKYKILSNLDIQIWDLLLIGFLLAVMYMTNAWDGGIYLLLSVFVLFVLTFRKFSNFLSSALIIALGLFVFSLPYNYFFKPFTSGIGVLCAPNFLTNIGKIGPLLFEKNFCQHSNWWELLTLYGFFYFFVISFLVFINRKKTLLKTDVFILTLIILSTLLIILPEFIYLKDIYPAHYRANTMFKLVFQSFIMLSISSSYIVFRILSEVRRKSLSTIKKIFFVSFFLSTVLLFSTVMIYPYLAINSYYGINQKDPQGNFKKPIGLDGTTYLNNLYPDDFKAIVWLKNSVPNQPVILEAQGDSYTDYARVSANTGLPTVLGWTVHEWLWRGTYDIPSPRIADVKTLYETTDLQLAKKLLTKYNVEYVFVGSLEYQKYPSLSTKKFEELGEIAYQNASAKVYKLSY